MNAQEMERRFLGSFIHTLDMGAQVQWLAAQPEIEDGLNALSNGGDWMTTRLADALAAVRCVRLQRIAEAQERERSANAFTVAAVLDEATLPQGVIVKLSPNDLPLDVRLDRPVTIEFRIGEWVIARYKLDPKGGEGKLRAGYKRFVREQLSSRLANRKRLMQNQQNESMHRAAQCELTA